MLLVLPQIEENDLKTVGSGNVQHPIGRENRIVPSNKSTVQYRICQAADLNPDTMAWFLILKQFNRGRRWRDLWNYQKLTTSFRSCHPSRLRMPTIASLEWTWPENICLYIYMYTVSIINSTVHESKCFLYADKNTLKNKIIIESFWQHRRTKRPSFVKFRAKSSQIKM